ncbi:hypothetical protein HC028_24755 [Planosporangium flavigriseum]|uniref:Uncharacterized protein n=1 Tax=Planosporangium flavigriseum TaxID=373681 RepID=A0A8J3LXY1_9ACTN|nr:hypothetical protein [Planosporangium flavigriseum]NJC67690.1 hypothetical protein [Planosporangium flavigriseum]GIG75834.1 hypothetical protein Pfl04_42380 [Planosporangium flavigriseum]
MSEENKAERKHLSPVQQQVCRGENPAAALDDETLDEGYEAAEARYGDDPRAQAPRDSAGRPSSGPPD